MLERLFKPEEHADMPSTTLTIGGESTIIFGAPGDSYFTGLQTSPDRRVDPMVQAFCDELYALPKDAVVIDVGANIGLTTVAAAKHLTKGRVIAVEPSPKAFRALSQTTKLNALANVTLVNKCLGVRSGTVPFIEAPMLAGSYVGVDAREAPTSQVEMLTLDAITQRLPRVDLVKIDVEGFELDVLKGAPETIKRFRPRFVMEFNSFALTANRNLSPRALVDFILDVFGSFEYERQDGGLAGVDNAEHARHFLYANMALKQCVEDITFGGV